MVDIKSVDFNKNNKLIILDQTRLPGEEKYLELETKEDVYVAIKKLRVRGAPAIGIAAAFGLYVASRDSEAETMAEFREEVHDIAEYLKKARPTAVNLAWALDRMTGKLDVFDGNIAAAKNMLLAEAKAIRQEDEDACRNMGEYGLSLLKKGMGILTHCNAGTLATAKYGTSLAALYLGKDRGYDFHIYADETRPVLQGSRLTAFELTKADMDVTLICDSMANQVMKNGWVDAVLVGCDRMAANGDGANKIGTNALAILAKEYNIPFYMFVPTSSLDLDTPTGDDIEIELRDGEEIYKMWYEKPMAPEGIKTYNPSFDVTPAEYITAIVTEKGIVRPPFAENLRKIKDAEVQDEKASMPALTGLAQKRD